MTAATKPQQTAVAARVANTPATRTDDDAGQGKGMERYAEFGRLPIHARAEVYRAREVRETADMVALTEWGSKLDEVQRAAVAKWCIRRDVDPVTELDNVGGPYINSEYYARKLGELRVRGVVRDVEQFHIGNDPRLAALAKDTNAPEDVREAAKREHYRRLELRIKHAAPEEAAAVHVTLLHLTAGGDPIEGVKWGGNGTSVKQPRHGGGSAPNPVVENNPALSVESQSVRRAMRTLAMKMPSALPEFIEDDTDTPDLRPIDRAPTRPLLPVPVMSGYDAEPSAERDETGKPTPLETVVERSGAASDERVATSATADAPRVPAESTAASEPTASADAEIDVVTRHPLTESGQWVVPAGDLRGRLLGTLDNERLVALRASFNDNAKFASKYAGTIEAIETVLEERREFAE